MVDPALLGLNLEASLRLEREQYCARVLDIIYSAGLEDAKRHDIILMNYSELPGGASALLQDLCGLEPDRAILEILRCVSEADAKMPSLPFPGDASMRPFPTDRDHRAAERLAGLYEQLESLRRRGSEA